MVDKGGYGGGKQGSWGGGRRFLRLIQDAALGRSAVGELSVDEAELSILLNAQSLGIAILKFWYISKYDSIVTMFDIFLL